MKGLLVPNSAHALPPLLLLALTTGQTSLASSNAGASATPSKAPPVTLVATKTLFRMRCAGCHGTSGAGDSGPNPRNLNGIIRKGSPKGMPPFGKVMSDQEIDAPVRPAMSASSPRLCPWASRSARRQRATDKVRRRCCTRDRPSPCRGCKHISPASGASRPPDP